MVAEQGIGDVLALGELGLLRGVCALMPMSVAPWRASSCCASRKAQLCGVQPRAPGMSSQPSSRRLARHARARVDVDDEALARRLGEVELAAERRGQGHGGNLGAREVVGGAVVDGHGEVVGRLV